MLQLYFASGLRVASTIQAGPGGPCLALPSITYLLLSIHWSHNTVSLFVPLLVSLPYNTKACSQKEGHKNEYLQNS